MGELQQQFGRGEDASTRGLWWAATDCGAYLFVPLLTLRLSPAHGQVQGRPGVGDVASWPDSGRFIFPPFASVGVDR